MATPRNSSALASVHRPVSDREPVTAVLYVAILGLTLALVFWVGRSDLASSVQDRWQELLFWALLIFVVDLFPVTVGELQWTLDMPILLTLAILYPPEVAALITLVASIDTRELTGKLSVWRALFNRFQVPVTVVLAGLTYRSLSAGLEPWLSALLATSAAALLAYGANVILVSFYRTSRSRISLGAALRSLTIGNRWHFLAIYVGYGLYALVLAFLFRRVGVWAVPLFLAPILVARQAFVREQRVQTLANRLMTRERLLERMLDRLDDERLDERSRIASDLHDDVLQSLIRLSQLSQFIRRGTPPGSQAARDVVELADLTRETIDSMRGVLGGLRESPLGSKGLVPTLQGLAKDLQMDWRVPFVVYAPGKVIGAPKVQLVLYQVAREASLNAVKHARPTKVEIVVTTSEDSMFLSVQDDGEGFDPETADVASHFGLGLIKERVSQLDGVLMIESQKGRGTKLSASLPSRLRSDR